MYKQVEKAKVNKSSAVANSVAQMKSRIKQLFGFVDNRPEVFSRQEASNNSPLVKRFISFQEMGNSDSKNKKNDISELKSQKGPISQLKPVGTVQFNGRDLLSEGLAQIEEEEEVEQELLDEYYNDDLARIDWVLNNWDTSSNWDSAIRVATIGQRWDYTVTFQWNLGIETVRAHVHYTDNHNGTYTKGPGNFWIRWLYNFSLPTPSEVVTNAPDDPLTI